MEREERTRDAEDIGRALLGLVLEGQDEEGLEERLKQIVDDILTPDLKKVKRTVKLSSAFGFPLELTQGSSVLLGGGGVVFQATNQQVPSLQYAIKTQRPSLVVSENARREGERAKAEYINHAPLSHQNIARLFNVFRIFVPNFDQHQGISWKNSPVMLMEWIEGALGLGDYISRKVKTPDELCDLVTQSFSSLEYLHSRQLIHWDIKSDNLLVNSAGQAKLMDIGNARWITDKPVDLVALTTKGNYPPSLRGSAVIEDDDDPLQSSRRVQLNLPSAEWDHPWLDLWMLARQLAELLGLGDRERLPHELQDLDPHLIHGQKGLTDKLFPKKDRYAQFVLSFLQLILRRLVFPRSITDSRYYNSASEVVADLGKLFPEFGAAQNLTELWAVPQSVIRLPVGKNVPLTSRIKSLIGTKPFQRLKSHMQLGMIIEVFPGGAHRRFEHSIGVYFTACEYVKALYADRANVFWRVSMESRDIEALLFAALLHDIGHIAYGHLLEEMEGIFKNRSHENYAQAVLLGASKVSGYEYFSELYHERLQRDREILEQHATEYWKIPAEKVDDFFSDVALILAGNATIPATSPNPILLRDAELKKDASSALKVQILHSIISSGIDADKLDYLLRDGVHTGTDYALGIDLQRFFQSLTVVHHVPESRASKLTPQSGPKVPSLQACIAVTDKGRLSVETILFARYQMFQSVYWHHTTRAHTAMLQYCVLEYLWSERSHLERAFSRLIEIFHELSDVEALKWLEERTSAISSKTVSNAFRGLLGERSNLYRECFALRFDAQDGDARAIYTSLMEESRKLQAAQTPLDYVTAARSLRVEFNRELARRIDFKTTLVDGDILIDIPPEGRDQIHNVFVTDRGKAERIQQISPMAHAVSETFRYWTRHFRIFCSPDLLIRSGLDRERLAELFGSIVREKYKVQLDLGLEGQRK